MTAIKSLLIALFCGGALTLTLSSRDLPNRLADRHPLSDRVLNAVRGTDSNFVSSLNTWTCDSMGMGVLNQIYGSGTVRPASMCGFDDIGIGGATPRSCGGCGMSTTTRWAPTVFNPYLTTGVTDGFKNCGKVVKGTCIRGPVAPSGLPTYICSTPTPVRNPSNNYNFILCSNIPFLPSQAATPSSP